MTDDLSAIIRRKQRSGDLNHISVGFSSKGLFSASYRGVDHADKRIVEHADAATALMWALTGRRPVEPAKTRTKSAQAPAVSVVDEDDLL